MIYTLTQSQKDRAEKARQEFAEIRKDDPTAIPPASFRQMLLNEERGWTWNVHTDQYEPENK